MLHLLMLLQNCCDISDFDNAAVFVVLGIFVVVITVVVANVIAIIPDTAVFMK